MTFNKFQVEDFNFLHPFKLENLLLLRKLHPKLHLNKTSFNETSFISALKTLQIFTYDN